MINLDDRDRAIIADRVAEMDERPGPRVGDFVIFADGVTRRISLIWGEDSEGGHAQSSDDGSFHLKSGYVDFSGALHGSVHLTTLTRTGETRDGRVWIFHHGVRTAHNAVDADVPFRVYRCTEAAPL